VRRLARGRASLALDEPGLGPAASCFVALRSAAVVTNRFTLRVRLAIERT
jgi:hypothetical protein